MGIQLIGNSGTVAEVETNTRALKVRQHPLDVLGSYQISGISGSMAAGLAGGSTIFSCRWSDATRVMLLRRFALEARVLGTAFTAGVFLFDLIVARGFTVADSAQSSILPTLNSQKRRTSFGTTLINDLRIANTGAITPGTRTLDGAAMMSLRGFVVATSVNYPMVGGGSSIPGASTVAGPSAPVDMFKPDFGGEWPLVFVANEGFIVRATVPATGVWDFAITMEWSEATSF